MKILFSFFILQSISTLAFAERLQTKIYSIELGQKKNESHLVKLTNGRVTFVDASDKETLKALKKTASNKELLEVEIGDKNKFLSAQSIPEISNTAIKAEVSAPTALMYSPTVIANLDEAQNIFDNMRSRARRNSQCYNRAHIWTYEENQRSGNNLMKLFLFFTNSYIRNYNYDWWFHVTPMALVNVNGATSQYTLDKYFTNGPLDVKSWTDIFVYSGKNCPQVSQYSQYNNNQETEDCYLFAESMYYWQPRDIEANEKTGAEKTSFLQNEVDWAYNDAF